ncbi:MAG: hypothetical protein FGM52_12070 [Mycobacterium sp.]|nr:hypothetical protein [Mycobacterium sp.]
MSDTARWPVLPAELASETDQLSCGTVYLTVPVRNGAIQVGSFGQLPTATIEVRRTPSAITVRRTDGAALQAQIIYRTEAGPELRSDVFIDAVPALHLRRLTQPDGRSVWLASPWHRTRRDAELVSLIKTIVAFGVAKQRQTATHRRLPATGYRLPASA